MIFCAPPSVLFFVRSTTVMTFTLLVVTAVVIVGGHMTSPMTTATPPSVPTVVVMLDDVIERENRYIPTIFRNINEVSEPGMREVHFDVVTVTNDSGALQLVCEKLQQGMVALVDMTSRHVAPLLRSLARNAGMAYISMVDSSYYRRPATAADDDQTVWSVEPVAVPMLRVVADIVIHDQLNNVALVYDDTFDIQNTPRRVLTNVPAQHLYVKINGTDDDLQRQVDMLMDITIKAVFVIANSQNAENFLGVLNQKETVFPDLFVLTKEEKLTCSRCSAPMRVVKLVGKTSGLARDQYIGYMKALGGVTEFFSDDVQIDEALSYDVARLIRLAMPANMTPIAYSSCSQVGVEYNPQTMDLHRLQSSKLVQALKNQSFVGVFGPLETDNGQGGYSDITLLVSEVNWTKRTIVKQIQLGMWSEKTKLNISTSSLTKAQEKRRYRVVTVPGTPPFVYKTEPSNITGAAVYDGYCIELLQELAQRLHFDYEIYDSPDGQFGSMNQDGSWSGLMNELIQKRADIAVGPISVMAERENVVDFTVPYYDLVGLTILMKKPEFDYSLVKFLSVLDEGVWACIIGAFFIFSVLICIFDRLSPFSYQNNRKEWGGEGQEPRVFTFKEGIWFCMMSLTPQGGGETPRALSGRLVAATWWLFGFIIIATYTANLAAFLTVSRLETQISSLDDLSKQFEIIYAPMNGSNAMIYFYRMARIEEKFYDIWKNMSLSNDMEAVERAQLAVWDYPVSDKYTKLWNTMKNQFPNSKDEGVQRVLTGQFAFIADATINKYVTYTNCDLWEVGEEFSRKPYALAVQEGSELRSELSNHILQLINQRKLEEMKTKWWDKDRLTCPSIENESDGISIKNIGGVFLVIAIGSALALLMLALECYWYKYKPKQKKKLYSLNSQGAVTKTKDSGQSRRGLRPTLTNRHRSDMVNGGTTFWGNGDGQSSGHLANGGLQGNFTNEGFHMSVME